MPRRIAGIGILALLVGVVLIYQPSPLFADYTPQVYYLGIFIALLGIILVGMGMHHTSR